VQGNSYQPPPLVNVVSTRTATAADRFVRMRVESPCLEAHFQLDFDYLEGSNPMFHHGAVNADAWYHKGWGLTWTPSEGSRSWF
jgi:hypothetical protein